MALGGLKINYKSISDKIRAAGRIKGQPIARKRAYDRFYRAKERFLRQFDDHIVTQEIKGGGDAKGAILGYGNLYSFLGFEEGTDPTEEIREKLEQYIYFINNPTYHNQQWVFKINLPSIEFIKRNTALPWGGGPSWITAVEKGLPNIISYLNFTERKEGSRSGYGIQSKHVVNAGRDFDGIPYITELLNNFRNTVNNEGLVR